MKVTNNQIINFRRNARAYLGTPADPKNPASKLHYALTKMLKQTEAAHRDYEEKSQEINVDFAESDKEGMLIIKDDKYVYKKKEAKERNQKINELLREEVEITPHIATSLPGDLSPVFLEVFIPFVIEESYLEGNQPQKEE